MDINTLEQLLDKNNNNIIDEKFQLIDFLKINMNHMNNHQKNIMNTMQLDRFIDQLNMILGLCRKWFSDHKFNKYTGIWKEIRANDHNNNNHNLIKLVQLSSILKVDFKQLVLKLNQINPLNNSN